MVHFPTIDPVAVYLGPLQLPWSVLFYLAAYGLANQAGLMHLRHVRSAVRPDDWDSLLSWAVIGALLMSRLAGRALAGNGATPALAFYAGLIGGIVAGASFPRRPRGTLRLRLDLLAMATPLFLVAYGFGALLDGTGWGQRTALPWGMVFPGVDGGARQPIALYVIVLQGGMLFAALQVYARRAHSPGQLFALFLGGFGAVECLLAPLRPDGPIHLWGGLAALVAGLLMFYRWRTACGSGTGDPGNGAIVIGDHGDGIVVLPVKPFYMRLAPVVLLAAALLAGHFLWPRWGRPSGKPPADLAQATFPDLHGIPQAIAQWRGKVVVLNFWATWCPPCRQEIPVLEAAQRTYAAKGLVVVGVALDDAKAVNTFARQYRIKYPLLIGGAAGSNLAGLLGDRLGVVPYTVVLDTQGRIVATNTGAINPVRLQTLVTPLLETREAGRPAAWQAAAR